MKRDSKTASDKAIMLLLCLTLSLSFLPLAGCAQTPQFEPGPGRNGVLAASYQYTVGVRKDGTVVAVGLNNEYQCNVSTWTQVIAVAVGGGFTLGLRRDGTVVGVGRNEVGQLNVSAWKDVVGIAAGGRFTLGLKKDGTVVMAGLDENGLSEVSTWKGIIAIAAGNTHAVGVKADGTVVAVGTNDFGQCDVADWKSVKVVAAAGMGTYGVKSDGTVVGTWHDNRLKLDVSGWRGIVAISSSGAHVVGLKSDGTVVATGTNDYSQCDVGDWKGVIAVSAGSFHTVGLKSDGTVVGVGNNEFGQRDVVNWKDIGFDPGISVTPGVLPTGSTRAELKAWCDFASYDDPLYMAVIDAYRKVEPGVLIELVEYRESSMELLSRLSAEQAAGNPGPDLLIPRESYVLDEMVKRKVLAPLDELGDISAFSQDAIDAVTYDGKFYASIGPISYPSCIFYNKTLFESAGVGLPATPTAFTALCAALKAKGISPVYYNDTTGGSFLSTWSIIAHSMAADFFEDLRTGKANTFQDPRFLATMTTILDWKKAGYLVQGEGTGEGQPDIEEFAAGHVAMIFSFVGYSPVILKKNPDLAYGAFAFPGPKGPLSARDVGPGFAVGIGSPNKEAAAAFVRYACTLAAQKTYVQFAESNPDRIGFIPTAAGVTITDPVLQEFAGRTGFVGLILTRLGKAGLGIGPDSTFTNSTPSLIDGSMTPEQIAEAMDKSVDFKRYQEIG